MYKYEYINKKRELLKIKYNILWKTNLFTQLQ
jgi:hypothetical protein